MNFNSIEFALFIPVVVILYWILPQKTRWFFLLISSYYFYMSWNPKYIFLIIGTTGVSYFTALIIDKVSSKKAKKISLITSIVLLIGCLFYFKYFNFVFDSIYSLCNYFKIELHPITVKVLLPVGISFYIFQNISYIVDVYRGEKPEKHFGIYATFISFFPQLVAGPIERTRNLLPQLKSEKSFDYNNFTYGLKQMAWGFFKKLAIADVVSRYVDAAYSNISNCTGLDIVCCILFFSIQIYCDFSGYSDIAIGTAKLLGINLMTNFKSPYFSTSIKEFWGRWHISLSTWFRDYVYIPLGGNRVRKSRNYINLIITFVISGLWHGANWTYVLWGGMHGVVQVFGKLVVQVEKKPKKVTAFLKWMMVFGFCNCAWVVFRASSLGAVWNVFKQLFLSLSDLDSFTYSNIGLHPKVLLVIILLLSILFIYDYFSLKQDVISVISSKSLVVRWTVYVFIVAITYLIYSNFGVSNASFVYFQF